MSTPLLILVALIYAYVGCEQAYLGSWSGLVVWVSYAMANLGLIFSLK